MTLSVTQRGFCCPFFLTLHSWSEADRGRFCLVGWRRRPSRVIPFSLKDATANGNRWQMQCTGFYISPGMYPVNAKRISQYDNWLYSFTYSVSLLEARFFALIFRCVDPNASNGVLQRWDCSSPAHFQWAVCNVWCIRSYRKLRASRQ